VPAELTAQRPLLERAAAGDRESFALLYDTQVEGVYRYLLAWTGNQLDAAELTSQVFHSAIGWLPATTGAEGEAGAWLIAMARDAVAHRQPPVAGESQATGAAVVAAVSRLGDPEREVVVLRLLLGHSLDHTAHLSGYSRRAATELQLAACLAIHELTTGSRPATPAPATPAARSAEARAGSSAEELELRLGHRETVLAGGAPARAGPPADAVAVALAVAGSLRRAAPGIVSAPTDGFVQRLRADLVAGTPLAPGSPRAPGPPGAPSASPAAAGPSSAGAGTGIGGWFSRRPWVATGVATAGIVVVLGFQAFGGPGGPPQCGGRPCPAPTTVVAVAGGGSTAEPPLTTVAGSSTTSSTVAGDAAVLPPPAAPQTSAATVPPSTRPATTRPPTTAPRPTTTTAPPTTAPPTTAAPTTTTVAPAPT
jgi:DNA-directed RNA polymerase specialized sigma24 family protein